MTGLRARLERTRDNAECVSDRDSQPRVATGFGAGTGWTGLQQRFSLSQQSPFRSVSRPWTASQQDVATGLGVWVAEERGDREPWMRDRVRNHMPDTRDCTHSMHTIDLTQCIVLYTV